jgi:alanine-synthesizing transaminase
MFVWAPIPARYKHLGSLDFAMQLLDEAEVCVSPGIGFGNNGEGYVRIALVENENRVRQAVRQIRRAMFR